MQWLKILIVGYLETEHVVRLYDHSMNDYYNLCKQQLKKENASN